MAVAGSAASSIYLALNGRQLFEGATMLRQSGIIHDTAAEAWQTLLSHGQCYLRLYGANLLELRCMYTGWLAEQKERDVDSEVEL